jgi:hypothetical protein
LIQRNAGALEEKRVYRPPVWRWVLLFCGGMTVFWLGAAIFGSQSPGLAAVFALGSFAATVHYSRRGLCVESAGVRLIVSPWLKARRIQWPDIDRFEVRYGVGKAPVTLIRRSDEQPIAVPTFPRPGRLDATDTTRAFVRKYRAKVESQVDELNQLLAEHKQAAA